MDKTIFSVVIFIGFLALFTGLYFSEGFKVSQYYTGAYYNGSMENMSVVSGQTTDYVGDVPTCEFAKDLDIPILGGLVWGASCIGSYLTWLANLIFLKSDIVWLQILFIGISAVIMYILIRILRGGG